MAEKTTILQKIGGVALGALALLGALLLINWGYARMTPATPAGGAQVMDGEDLQDAPAAAPCTATNVLPLVSCGCPENVSPGRNDLFPGSYVSFAYANAGCDASPRNKRC